MLRRIAMIGLAGAAVALAPAGAATGVEDETSPALKAAGLVPVHQFAPSIRLQIVNATSHNFTGKRLPGYCKPWALLRRNAAKALAKAHYDLRRNGLGIKVYDAYRPVRATRALVHWAESHGRADLVGTKIARRSNHNLGSAVDVTLVQADSGRDKNMGGGLDRLDDSSITLNARGKVLRNRLRLRHAMESNGFRNYFREWWHFDYSSLGPRRLDIPLGC
jgi:D-alanyl-D-alanine dipeptidase